jgi:hypothetical protein
LQFWPDGKSFEEVCKDVSVSNEVHGVLKHKGKIHPETYTEARTNTKK